MGLIKTPKIEQAGLKITKLADATDIYLQCNYTEIEKQADFYTDEKCLKLYDFSNVGAMGGCIELPSNIKYLRKLHIKNINEDSGAVQIQIGPNSNFFVRDNEYLLENVSFENKNPLKIYIHGHPGCEIYIEMGETAEFVGGIISSDTLKLLNNIHFNLGDSVVI